jgi:hypothetical protein
LDVVSLAHGDYLSDRKPRSGTEIVKICAGEHRNFHKRMATGIYNMTRRTLECGGR